MQCAKYFSRILYQNILTIILLVLIAPNIYAQCENGSEIECECETAELFCSLDEFDGYSGTLGSFLDYNTSGPSEFCGDKAVINNPSWFSFAAWCDNITIQISFDNCTGNGIFRGLQGVVFSDCTYSEEINCDERCDSETGRFEIELRELTIGETYYLMIDGCGGSICDFEISIDDDCDDHTEDWEEPISEDEIICIGSSVSYNVGNIVGALSYSWYINGTLVETTDNPSNNINWNDEGIFELCVDVSRVCYDVGDAPEPNCSTIIVSAPDAGELDIDDSPECPDEYMEILLQNYNDALNYVQVLIFVDQVGDVILVLEDTHLYDFTWPTCENIKLYSLNFIEDADLEIPDIGDEYYGTNCIDNCCDEICTDLLFEDDKPPRFIRTASDITIDCYDQLALLDIDELEELRVIDNCADKTDVLGVETILVDDCNGGIITREWHFVDPCGLEAYHKQTITILPLPIPQFIDPPSDITMNNLEYESLVIPQLTYHNGLVDSCEVSGSINPVIEDFRNGCSGFVNVLYELNDSCGNQVIAQQRIDIISDAVRRDTTLHFCDSNMQGFVNITKEYLDNYFFQNQPDLKIQYFFSETDLDFDINEISFPINSDQFIDNRIFAKITDTFGCIFEWAIEINLHTNPSLILDIKHESCLDNNDGSIEILSPTDLSNYVILVNSDTLENKLANNLVVDDYNIKVQNQFGCEIDTTISINEGIDIEIDIINIQCNDNGTSLLPEDDFYTVDFIVNGGTGEYTLDLSLNLNQGTFNYTEPISIDIPINNNSTILTATDNIFNCTTTYDLGILTHCSSDCGLGINHIDYNCDNNDTPLDPNDDFYLVNINVSSQNAASSNQYNLFVDDILTYTFNYDEENSFILAADNLISELKFEDVTQNACNLIFSTDILKPCSDLCQLEINIETVECIDPNTPWDNDDDLFQVQILVNGSNASSSFSLTPNGEPLEYGELILLDANLISNGIITINVFDSVDTNCNSNVQVEPPLPCSSPCEIELLNLEILECNDNLTGSQDDDFFNVSINIANISDPGSQYNLVDSQTNSFGPYNYGSEYTIGPFVADGNDIILSLIDQSNLNCHLDLTFSKDPCSTCNNEIVIIYDYLILDCVHPFINLTGESSSDIEEYNWSGPNGFTSTLPAIEVDMEGEYTLEATFNDGCQDQTSIAISSNQIFPQITFEEIPNLNCETGLSCVSASTSNEDFEYYWYDLDENLISNSRGEHCFDESGEYILEIINTETGCLTSEFFEIEDPTYPIISLEEEITIINDQVLTLYPSLNIDESLIAEVIWTTNAKLSCYDCLSPSIIQVEDNTVATLSIITTEGCETNAEVLIRVETKSGVYIPNIFRPSMGDNFTIYSNEVTTIEKMSIWDRWGNLIYDATDFSSNDSSLGWDGTKSGNQISDGVYVFAIQYQSNGKEENVFGSVTLLK